MPNVWFWRHSDSTFGYVCKSIGWTVFTAALQAFASTITHCLQPACSQTLIRGGVSISWRTFDAEEAAVLQINPISRNYLAGSRSRLLASSSAHSYDINRPGRPSAHYTCIQHPSSVLLPIPIKGVLLASPFSATPRNAIHHPYLLLGPFYPRQPNST